MSTGVELRHLETFVTVAETLHFGRAAERLHLAQPAVSQQIHRLETVLATRLLERNRRSTRLTDAGRAFLPEARRTLATAAGAVEVAAAVGRGDAGRLRLGVAPSAAAGPSLRAISTVANQVPRVAVDVQELRQRDLVGAVRGGDIELGLGAVLRLPSRGSTVEWLEVGHDDFVIALAADHPLARRPEPIPLSAFDGQPFVSFPRDEGPRYADALLALLGSAGVEPARQAIVRERSTQLALVASGLGVALVPAWNALLRPADVVYRRLREETPRLTTVALWRADNDSAILARALRHVRRVAAGPP